MRTKVNYTDPTYLRTIHDGLLSGAVHKDNASALPLGLVGLYEKELPPARNVNERKKFLEFFSVWALLKKEASVAFVLPLLEGWTEEQVVDYIAHYSKWFNSPVSGKYVLYHERLRTFILQKVAHHHFKKSNNDIIQQGQIALKTKVGDEWEHYALEHLSTHLLIGAMESQDGSDLKALAYHSDHWNRQIEISKNFKWSKNLLNDMMLWASKYDEDEVIECALYKIDLYHLEQNDAPRIVELVAQNDLETALQRIESFGGNDKEGLQRKFILYMLCLLELTLLDIKNKPFRKEAIEKLLKHLDDTIPTDHSILNWNDFFPSYLMFQMAFEWAELGLDCLITFRRTDDWEKTWIEEKGPYTDLQLDVLLACAREISDESDKSTALKAISTELAKRCQLEKALCAIKEALVSARRISVDNWKSNALASISTVLFKQGFLKDAASVMKDAHVCAIGISEDSNKIYALTFISTELGIQTRMEESVSVIQEAFACANKISDQYKKSSALKDISTELAKQGQVEEALACAHLISDMSNKCFALKNISAEFVSQTRKEEAASVILEALACAREINDYWKSYVLTAISDELAKQGQVEKAFTCANEISDDENRNRALKNISSELAKQGQAEEALVCARGISNDYWKSSALGNISTKLWKDGRVDEASTAIQESLSIALSISIVNKKSSLFKDISIDLGKQGHIEKALSCALGISDTSYKSSAFKGICTELASKGLINVAATSLQESISSTYRKCYDKVKKYALVDISIKLGKQGRIQEALASANLISDDSLKYSVHKVISFNLCAKGKIVESLACAKKIRDDYWKSSALGSIGTEMVKQGFMEGADSTMKESLYLARRINDDYQMCSALGSISTELSKQGNLEEAASLMQESLEFALEIKNDYWKSNALKDISTELAKQGQVEEALSYARGISDESHKSSALKVISAELVNKFRVKEAASAIQEALSCARRISDDFWKISSLGSISTEFTKQGYRGEAISVIQEALSCAKGISQDYKKCYALRTIIKELAYQGRLEEAEIIGMEIPQIEERHNCWKSLAQIRSEEIGGLNSIQQVMQFKNEEVRYHFIQGWAEHVAMLECSKELFLSTWHFYRDDMKSMQEILQKFAINQLFFEETKPETIQRLNRSLNIQWAIDLKNSFSAN